MIPHPTTAAWTLAGVVVICAAVLSGLHDVIPSWFPDVVFALIVGGAVAAPVRVASPAPPAVTNTETNTGPAS